jgi:hypothetical protein
LAWRRDARAFVELFALCGFAITQPLLDLFGKGVEQFALRQASPGQIVGFGIGVALAPALGLWLLELGVGIVSQRARRLVHLVVLALLVGAVVVQAARPVVTGPGLAVVALATGILAVVALLRFRAVRLWLSFAAVAPVGFLGLFLVASPAADLMADGTAGEPVEVGAPAPVVVLVLDELPIESLLTEDGSIDGAQYPAFARLAAGSHWFRRTTAVTPATWHAVPTILTGRVPEDGAAPIASHHPDNLFTLLAGSHDLEVTETVTRLCPSSLCAPPAATGDVWRGLAGDAFRVLRSRLSLTRDASDPVAGFAELTPPPEDELDLDEGVEVSQPARFRSLIEGLGADQPALHHLHLLLPHVPYRHLPSGTSYDNPSPDLGRDAAADQWLDETWPVTLGRQRHLLQLRYVDRLLGVLLDELEARDLYDDALLVVTADHGIHFEAGGPIRAIEGQALDGESAADILAVPFFLKEPGQVQGTVDDRNVLAIDVLPTIADVLDIELPFEVDGRSALGAPRTDVRKPYYGNDVNSFTVAVQPPVTFDGDALWDRVLARSAGAFLGGGPPDAIWSIGPSSELVGQAVADVPAGTLVPAAAELRAPDAYASVPERGTTPALVRGLVEGVGPGTPLAVAVNGVIAATGPVYREEGRLAFAMMVDEAWFRPGANEVRVYEARA